MADPKLASCIVCGKAFRPVKGKANRFCGHACYRVAQRRGDYKRGVFKSSRVHACARCGARVVKTPTKDRKGRRCERVFCSRACYDAYRVERRGFCVHCGGRLPAMQARGAKYCSWACRVEHRRPEPRNCLNCGCLFTPVKPIKRKYGVEMIAHSSGKTCSAQCNIAWISNNEERKRKISVAFTGSNHPNWEGGKAHLNNSSYRGPGWLKTAEKARKRDGYCCQRCGKTQEDNGRLLDVHHIVPFHNFNSVKRANRMSNLVTLCQKCHRIVEWETLERQMVLPLSESSQSKSSKAGARFLISKLKKTPALSSLE